MGCSNNELVSTAGEKCQTDHGHVAAPNFEPSSVLYTIHRAFQLLRPSTTIEAKRLCNLCTAVQHFRGNQNYTLEFLVLFEFNVQMFEQPALDLISL